MLFASVESVIAAVKWRIFDEVIAHITHMCGVNMADRIVVSEGDKYNHKNALDIDGDGVLLL